MSADDARTDAHRRLATWVQVGVLVLIAGWILHLGRTVFVPAVLGALLVYVILGLTRLSGRLPRIGPWLPAGLRALVAVAIAVGALAVIAWIALANLDRLAARLPKYQASLLATIQALAVRAGIDDEPTWATLREVALAQGHVQSILGTTVSLATAIVSGTVIVLLYMAFLLVERGALPAKFTRLSPDPANAERLRAIVADINNRVGTYLALKALLGAIQGIASYAVMRAFGLEFATFWAMLIVLLNFVPYLGSMLSLALPVAMGVVQFSEPGTMLALLVALGAVQFVIGNFIDPWLLGNSLNLSPLAILVSLSVWTSLWGIAGAFLAVPVTAAMAIIFSEFDATRPVAVLLSRDGTLSTD